MRRELGRMLSVTLYCDGGFRLRLDTLTSSL